MTSLIFPDVNVWLALNYDKHVHNPLAVRWYKSLGVSSLFVFCRQTQLGLFRLLSSEIILKENARKEHECWSIFDQWIDSGEAVFVHEPHNLDRGLRAGTSVSLASPKVWADAYLAAFAEEAGLALVTFDRLLAGKAKGAILLA